MDTSQTEQKPGIMGWIDRRFPFSSMMREHLTEYYAPKNFNFWYFFGSLLILVLVIQIITGIFLTMHYQPNAKLAFWSINQGIMNDVEGGWFIRYMHVLGASSFFVLVYFHMFRGMMYGSYKKPRELLWLVGMLLYVALSAEAFFGYLLPWGQMSFWGSNVVISLFGAIPVIGQSIAQWIRGDFVVGSPTLDRFFALHVIAVPLVLVILVFVHILALHQVGSNNPDGIEIKEHKNADGIPLDGIPFHPYYTVKDILGVAVFLAIYMGLIFFKPSGWGIVLDKLNYVPANALKTPPDIHPLWFLTPYYAILRAWPSKLLGVASLAAVYILMFLIPWLDRNPVKSARFRGVFVRINILVLSFSFILLGYLGLQPATNTYVLLGYRFTEIFFSTFWLMVYMNRVRSHMATLIWWIVMTGLFVVIDAWMVSVRAHSWGQLLESLWLPIGYVTIILGGAWFKPSLVADKPVPERVQA
ncbi:cytochrome b [Acidihalobacter prosperus]|uniref:Cytochrome b n=1 Tax=Acidihalobacter prosperus TaxID=160660 RepID=A0A1A6C8X3_9GAMM|nr:cytochrome b N-terminal domain-containing protein [Acidihalobacter prosperus]OBS11013.1 cytochrome b [Acidihalobacter prosperus]